MKVLFHTNTINYRGTTVAVTDYARYNQTILGNESVIAYCKTYGGEKDMGNEEAVVEALEKEFKLISYRAGDLPKKIDNEKVDVAYFIKAGQRDGVEERLNCKTAVHAVFQFNEPHGDSYAYVSKWLSDTMSGGTLPYVPHIVSLPEPTASFRNYFQIKPDQIVIGRIGGYFTFDIPEVKQYIEQLVNKSDKFVFLFVGTEPFIDHPNVKFINEMHSLQKKANFINTCDGMIHARSRGESFGLSIAEFLSLNKPVFAFNNGYDKNHIEMLKGGNTLYNNISELDKMLHSVRDFKEDWARRVEEFRPAAAMKKFNEVFL